MTTELLSVDQVLDIAFDIFDEMAEDNLEIADLENYHANFDEKGAAIALEPNDDWEKQLGFAPNKEEYFEVQIGFALADVMDDVLVRMLITCDATKKDCHLLWKGK